MKVGGLGIDQLTHKSARRAIEWFEELELYRHRAADRPPDPARDRRAAALPGQRGRGLPVAGAGGGHAVGRRGPADPAGHPDRLVLVGVLYILDEPSIGLHQRDNERLIATLERLRDLGNTVIVVEHDEGTMRAADHIVDLGPGRRGARRLAGRRGHAGGGDGGGGVAHRPVPRRAARDRGAGQAAAPARPHQRSRGPRSTTCAKIDVKVPLGVFTASPACRARASPRSSTRCSTRRWPTGCTGPSSGRARTSASTGLDQIDKIINIDQSPIGRTPRSNPATYIGLFDHIRELFSQAPRRRARAATSRAASRSTSRAGAARSAAATARSRSRCTSCRTSTCPASSATASATTARRSRSASRARPSPTCSR